MKTVSLGIIVCLCFSTLATFAGQDRGNGGDTIAMDFVNSGTRIFNYIKRHPSSAIALGINPELLLPEMRKIRVEAVDQLYLNNIEVDAINYPNESLIKISSTRWVAISNLPNARIMKQNLALHEYLGVLGFDDTNYRLSSGIISEVRNEEVALQPNPASDTMLGALCKAIVERDYVTAKALLQLRFDVNRPCPNEISTRMTTAYPLPYMIQSFQVRSGLTKDDFDLIESLLMAGADPNGYVNNVYWETSLLTVLIKNGDFKGGLETAQLLVSYGANPNGQGLVETAGYRTGRNKSAFHEALSPQIPESLDPAFLGWIIDAGADMNRLALANPGWILDGENTPACEIMTSSRQDLKKVLIEKVKVDSDLCKYND